MTKLHLYTMTNSQTVGRIIAFLSYN